MNYHPKPNSLLRLVFVIAFVIIASVQSVSAAEIRVAVASNFHATLRVLAAEFERHSGHSVVAISGSSGKHFAQIVNGAPFDIFLAADSERPRKLLTKAQFAGAQLKNYAIGRLVLWRPGVVSAKQAELALFDDFNYLALANPLLAPYGAAAQDVLASLSLIERTKKHWVVGENVSQAFQFVASGNAELGFVAESQLLAFRAIQPQDFWRVPKHLYPPIEQTAVLLSENPSSTAFYNFLSSDQALRIISENGYDKP